MSAAQACTSSSGRLAAAPGAAFRRRPHPTAFVGQPVALSRQHQQQAGLAHGAAHAAGSGGRRPLPARPARRAPAAAAAASATAAPSLDSLEFHAVVTMQGYISPEIPEGTEATVFAIYDEARILQYIGFSKGLRDSLRTLFSRRPDKAHQYRALHLPQLDQQRMMDVRAAWFDNNHGPPPGNKLPTERDQWQAPVVAFSISERGRLQAAVELAKTLQERIVGRGCKEEFVPNAELLAEGKVDFLPAAALTPEEVARQKAFAEAAAAATRACEFVLDGQPASFDIFYRNTIQTNGGHMFDLTITYQDKESFHRVIVGRDYYEPQGVSPQDTVERVFAFLLKKKIMRQTEGLLLNGQFSPNYFSISQVEQHFDDFTDEFEKEVGELASAGGFWRFNRTEDYGFKGENETVEQLIATFSWS